VEIKVNAGSVENERKIEINIPWVEIEPKYTKKMNDARKKVKMPGFRPGKVPKALFEKQYGPSIVAELMDQLIQEAYIKTLDDNDLEPIEQGRIDNIDVFDVGRDLNFSIVMEVEPTVPVFNYKKGFSLTKKLFTPTEDDVNHALGHLQEQHATVTPIEDGAKNDDLIQGDIQYLNEDGSPIEGDRLENRYVKIGDGIFGADAGDQLMGAKIDDEIVLNIPNPEKDKPALHMAISVKGVERHDLPEIDEDFAKLVNPDVENLEALKGDILKDIQAQLDNDVRRTWNQDIAEYFVTNTNFDIPKKMLEEYIQRIIAQVKNDARNPVTEEEIRERNQAKSEWELRWYLIKKEIVKIENIDVTTVDFEAKLDELVAQMPGDKEQMKKFYREKQYSGQIREDLLEAKLFAHIESFIKIKEKTVSTKEMGGYHGHAH
jgi:trigger factor